VAAKKTLIGFLILCQIESMHWYALSVDSLYYNTSKACIGMY